MDPNIGEGIYIDHIVLNEFKFVWDIVKVDLNPSTKFLVDVLNGSAVRVLTVRRGQFYTRNHLSWGGGGDK